MVTTRPSNIKDLLEDFSKCMVGMGEIIDKVYNLQKLASYKEISLEASSTIREQYFTKLIEYAKEFFRLMDLIEKERAICMLELERSRSNPLARTESTELLQNNLSNIEAAYRAIDFIVGLIATKYCLFLSFKAMKDGRVSSEEYERQKEVAKKFLDVLAERWSAQKPEFNNRVAKFELELNKLKEEMKERGVRYYVGEYDKSLYEKAISSSEQMAKDVEEKVHVLRKYIEGVDTLMFECYLLYSEPESELASSSFEEVLSLPELPDSSKVINLIFETEGITIEKAYDKLVEHFTTVYDSDQNRARMLLERELRKRASLGVSRERAIMETYRSIYYEKG